MIKNKSRINIDYVLIHYLFYINQFVYSRLECLEDIGIKSYCYQGVCCGSLYCCDPTHAICKSDICVPKFNDNEPQIKYMTILIIGIISVCVICFLCVLCIIYRAFQQKKKLQATKITPFNLQDNKSIITDGNNDEKSKLKSKDDSLMIDEIKPQFNLPGIKKVDRRIKALGKKTFILQKRMDKDYTVEDPDDLPRYARSLYNDNSTTYNGSEKKAYSDKK